MYICQKSAEKKRVMLDYRLCKVGLASLKKSQNQSPLRLPHLSKRILFLFFFKAKSFSFLCRKFGVGA